MNNYVIAGNGIAATGCIEGIRSVDGEGKITVVSEETRPAYCRPLISYLLEGKADYDNMPYREKDFYEKNRCSVVYGKSVKSVLPGSREAVLSDGEKIGYEKFCIACGSSPFVPPFEGLETVVNKSAFMTLDDALKIKESLTASSKVLIAGAGLIGLKCAEGIRNLCGSITVFDLADRVLSSILDKETAAEVQKHLENYGIGFHLEDTAVRFEKDRAFMKSGKTISFDYLVLAVGVKPNTSLLKGFDGAVNKGILTDLKMQTVIPDIFAAGDCAESYDMSVNSGRVLAILPSAYMQGYAAGVNMAGGNMTIEDAIPLNSIGFFGNHIMTAGSYDGDLFESSDENCRRRLFVRDGILKGYIITGNENRAGIYTSLIKKRIPLSSVDFEILKLNATTAALPAESRRKIFGGVV